MPMSSEESEHEAMQQLDCSELLAREDDQTRESPSVLQMHLNDKNILEIMNIKSYYCSA